MYGTALNADSEADFAGPMKSQSNLVLPPPEVRKFGSSRPPCTSLSDCLLHGYERFHAHAVPWVGVGHRMTNMDLQWGLAFR